MSARNRNKIMCSPMAAIFIFKADTYLNTQRLISSKFILTAATSRLTILAQVRCKSIFLSSIKIPIVENGSPPRWLRKEWNSLFFPIHINQEDLGLACLFVKIRIITTLSRIGPQIFLVILQRGKTSSLAKKVFSKKQTGRSKSHL